MSFNNFNDLGENSDFNKNDELGKNNDFNGNNDSHDNNDSYENNKKSDSENVDLDMDVDRPRLISALTCSAVLVVLLFSSYQSRESNKKEVITRDNVVLDSKKQHFNASNKDLNNESDNCAFIGSDSCVIKSTLPESIQHELTKLEKEFVIAVHKKENQSTYNTLIDRRKQLLEGQNVSSSWKVSERVSTKNRPTYLIEYKKIDETK